MNRTMSIRLIQSVLGIGWCRGSRSHSEVLRGRHSSRWVSPSYQTSDVREKQTPLARAADEVFNNLDVQTFVLHPVPRSLASLPSPLAPDHKSSSRSGRATAPSHCDSRDGRDAGALMHSANGPITSKRWGEPKIELLFVPSTPSAACDEWCCRRAVLTPCWCIWCMGE